MRDEAGLGTGGLWVREGKEQYADIVDLWYQEHFSDHSDAL